MMNIREVYEQKVQVMLDELNAEIDKLKAKEDKAEADTKIKYSEEIKKLSIMQDQFSKKLTELKDAGDSTWEELKSDIEKLSGLVESTLRSAISKFQ